MKSTNMIRILCAAILLVGIVATAEAKSMQSMAQEILNNIYKVTADYRFEKPALAFSSAKRDVAYFFPDKNTLTIELAALEVCRSLGQDSISALAFIIGHELAHVYQEEMRQHDFTSSFLTYDKAIHARIRTEKQADIQGALSAYLSGYKIENVIPKLIDKLYLTYGLNGKILEGYPTIEERQKTVSEVNLILEELITLWENTPFLSIIGSYAYAAQCYEYIGKYYRGSELLNNAGLNYLLEAINTGESNIDSYILPIEFNYETRLKKPKVSYGAKDFDFKTYTKRLQLLERAKKYFEDALSQDGGNSVASLNLTGCLILMNEPQKAYDIIKSKEWPTSSKNKFDIMKSIALISINSQNESSAIVLLNNVIKTGNYYEKEIASMNKMIIEQDAKHSISQHFGCSQTVNSLQSLNFNATNKSIIFNDPLGTVANFNKLENKNYFEINSTFGVKIIIYNSGISKPTKNISSKNRWITNIGTLAITHCPESKTIELFNSKGEFVRQINYSIY